MSQHTDKDSHQWPNACVNKGPSEEPGPSNTNAGSLSAADLPGQGAACPCPLPAGFSRTKGTLGSNGHWTNKAPVL